ncbi:MAG: acetyltransferase [Desulfobacteraceae bacterium]|nr:acetyltransferase [Desulfobacteraceae bacterium]
MLIDKEFVIIGAGGHARVIVDTLLTMGFSLKGIVDVEYSGQKEKIMGYPVLGGLEFVEKFNPDEIVLSIAIGDNTQRRFQYDSFKQKGFFFPSMVHPAAIVSESSHISDGVFINAGAIINSNARIGENCIINTGSIIEHEVTIGEHCHICPGAKIAGRVNIGNNSFIGIGANIIDYIKIGHDVVVGAGSVIIDDIASESTYVGVPGRKIK